MRRYTYVSGAFFTLLAAVQLVRVILQWPLRVADLEVPVWVSVIAVLIAGSFAVWAFRLSARSDWGSSA